MSFTTLVDAATLVTHLNDPDWRIIDVRHQLLDTAYGERSYREGHIPGALFMHCDSDLSGSLTGKNGRHPLPAVDSLAARLGACGIGSQTQVVVYDDAQGMIAGRLWWLLRWLGHDKVAVLDGGLQTWLSAQGPLSKDAPVVAPEVFVPRESDCRVDTDFVRSFLETSRLYLVDARSPDRFRGENETMDPVGGHIPGAVNRFFRDNLQENGCFKPAEQLRAEWLALLDGVKPELVVHQCGSGVSACHNILAMQIAGFAGSKLYGGSWSEWCADPDRPVSRD